mgnify:CR=1 FL=1
MDNSITILKDDNWEWNLKGNTNRIIKYNEDLMSLLASVFETNATWESIKLVNLQSKNLIKVLDKLEQCKTKVKDFKPIYSEGFHETDSIKKGEDSRSGCKCKQLVQIRITRKRTG